MRLRRLKMYAIPLVGLIAATFLSAFSLAPLLQPAPVEAQQFEFEEPPPAAPEEQQGGEEQSVERQQSTQGGGGGGEAAEEEEEEAGEEEEEENIIDRIEAGLVEAGLSPGRDIPSGFDALIGDAIIRAEDETASAFNAIPIQALPQD